jgi:hypothetical protein
MNKTHCAQAIALLLACSLVGCVTRTASVEKQTETIDFRLFQEGGTDEYRLKNDLVELRSTQYPSENNPEFIIHFRVLDANPGGERVEVALVLLDTFGKSLHRDAKSLPISGMRQSFAVDHDVFRRAERARITFTIQE